MKVSRDGEKSGIDPQMTPMDADEFQWKKNLEFQI
jgi:hypothetical protein